MEGYGVPFDWSEYEIMAATMRSMQGKAMLSINDHPDVRRCFAGLHTLEVPIKYTVGGGQNAVDRTELVISNWDVDAEPVGLF